MTKLDLGCFVVLKSTWEFSIVIAHTSFETWVTLFALRGIWKRLDLGISGDSSRCMTIDAFDLWIIPRRADDLIWLLSDHADAS